jgi:hypothetical protein
MEENRKKAKQFSGMFKNSNELIINYGTEVPELRILDKN